MLAKQTSILGYDGLDTTCLYIHEVVQMKLSKIFWYMEYSTKKRWVALHLSFQFWFLHTLKLRAQELNTALSSSLSHHIHHYLLHLHHHQTRWCSSCHWENDSVNIFTNSMSYLWARFPPQPSKEETSAELNIEMAAWRCILSNSSQWSVHSFLGSQKSTITFKDLIIISNLDHWAMIRKFKRR